MNENRFYLGDKKELYASIERGSTVEFYPVLEKKSFSLGFLSPANFLIWRSIGYMPTSIDYIFVDSGSLALLLKHSLGLPIHRRSFDFTSLAGEFFNYASVKGVPVLAVGSTDLKVQRAAEHLSDRFDQLTVFPLSGYLTDEEIISAASVFSQNNERGFVLLGLGASRQDSLAERMLGELKNLGIITCGGFLEQASERLDYYPRLVQRFRLRWLYRAIRLRSVSKLYAALVGLVLLFYWSVRFRAHRL